jgi:hypothetical protein
MHRIQNDYRVNRRTILRSALLCTGMPIAANCQSATSFFRPGTTPADPSVSTFHSGATEVVARLQCKDQLGRVVPDLAEQEVTILYKPQPNFFCASRSTALSTEDHTIRLRCHTFRDRFSR